VLTERLKAQLPQELRWPDYGLVFGQDELHGAVVRAVEDGSPAARSGLAVGDRIVRAFDQAVDNLGALEGLDAQDTVVRTVFRDGRLYLVRLSK